MTAKTPPTTGRKRLLSDEERALWREVVKTATPLQPRKPVAAAETSTSTTGESPRAKGEARAPVIRPVVKAPPLPPLVPLGRRERSRVARGRHDIDARLDLHGLTQERAHRRLITFLQSAHDNGATFVLIITGKGRDGDEAARGVLRRQVPHWLALPELRALVLGFEPAHAGHGGDGALYVRLRRTRRAARE